MDPSDTGADSTVKGDTFLLDSPRDPGIDSVAFQHMLWRWMMIDILAISVFFTCVFTFMFIINNPDLIPLPQIPLPYLDQVRIVELLEAF